MSGKSPRPAVAPGTAPPQDPGEPGKLGAWLSGHKAAKQGSLQRRLSRDGQGVDSGWGVGISASKGVGTPQNQTPLDPW